jgi:uncharacterized SAM-binding protein YcdF (DUF218 family)
MDGQNLAEQKQEDQVEEEGRTEPYADKTPIEPEGGEVKRPNIVKWVFFLLVIAYTVISYYRAPILTHIGEYLIVEHPLKKADVIVCMMGSPVERGLSAAELYRKGLAPQIFLARPALYVGSNILQEKGGHYPERRHLLLMMLEGLGVPKSAFVTSDVFVGSTFEEAKVIGDLARKRGYSSLIVVTSPYHTRRTWLTLKRVLGKEDVEIIMTPSRHTNFRADEWWKKRLYLKSVIVEYQKLLYYVVKYL